MGQPQDIETVRAKIRANIDSNSAFDSAYVIMNGLSTVVACYGLFENSPAVVIGAMIIAMLLGPIAGVSMGLVDRNSALLQKALLSLLGGFFIIYATAFLLGLIHRDIPLTDEIYARTAPNLMDLMIALGGGAAGAFSMIAPRLSMALVGVAIATALVPPASSSAICLARGEYALALGAFLLTVTNIVGIQVAGSVVMWLGGYRGSQQRDRLGTLKRNLLSVAVLCALAVFLGEQLQDLVSKQRYEESVRKLLTSAAKSHNGADLVDVRFREEAKRTVIVAVYRTHPHSLRKRWAFLNHNYRDGEGRAAWSCWFVRSRLALRPDWATCSPRGTHVVRRSCHENRITVGAALLIVEPATSQ